MTGASDSVSYFVEQNGLNSKYLTASLYDVYSDAGNDGDGFIERNYEDILVWGNNTWKLRTIYTKHEASANHLPAASLRKALHELSLYPSISQVHEMLECAGISQEASRDYVTFGEFCVLATELAQLYAHRTKLPVPQSAMKQKLSSTATRSKNDLERSSHYQVFLGGSCNPTTWRTDTAIPYLKQHGITFYNPQVTQWKPEMIELEAEAKKNADVLFFVIDNQTRATVSMVEVAYLLGDGRNIIPVVTGCHSDGDSVAGEKLSQCERRDLARSHALITDLIERQSIPAFSSVEAALSCVTACVNKNVKIQDLSSLQRDGRVEYGHLRVGLDLVRLREAFTSVDSDQCGRLNISDVCLAYRCVMSDALDWKWLCHMIKSNKTTFTFDEFCCLVSERRKILMGQSWWQDIVSYVMTSIKWFFGLGSTTDIGQKRGVCDLYLGGSGNTDWMQNTAVPALKKHGLTYALHRSSHTDHLLPSDAMRRDSCRVLLYVISADSCGSSEMVEAAYNIGRGCRMVLCIQPLKGNSLTHDDKLSSRAIEDYNRGRCYLSDLANRQAVSCFTDINEAIIAAIEKVRAIRRGSSSTSSGDT